MSSFYEDLIFVRVAQGEEPTGKGISPHAILSLLSLMERGHYNPTATKTKGATLFELDATKQTRFDWIVDQIVAWRDSGGHPCGYHPLPINDPGRVGFPARHVFETVILAKTVETVGDPHVMVLNRDQVKTLFDWTGGD